MQIAREPLLTWEPTLPATHPMNYFVPNFGVDHEIAASTKNEAAASGKLGHQWTPVKDEDDEWTRIPEVFTLNGRYIYT